MIRLKVQETSQRFRIITETPVNFNVESGIPLYPEEYTGSYEVTPSESEQTLETDGLMMTDDVTIGAIQTETKSVNPTESAQTVTHTSGKYMTEVTVGAIDSEYVGSDVPRRSSLNVDGLNVSAPAGYYEDSVSATVSAPLQEKSRTVGASGTYEDTPDSGYYGLSKVTNTVPSGSMSIVYDTGFTTINNNRKWRFRGTANVNPKGWFNQGNNYGSYISYDALESTTVTPTESSQTVGGANTMMEGAVTVNPIPSQYIVPTGNVNITHSGSTDVTNYATATVPDAEPFVGGNESYFTENGQFKWRASNFIEVDVSQGDKEGWLPDGYHQDQPITKMAIPSGTTITPSTSSQTIGGANFMLQGAVTVSAMPSGTAGTPTATKGTVSNHSVTVTPSVTNSAGYISGGTKTGTAVTVSASELVSGSQNITANANNIDVTNLASVNVQVPTGTPSLQTKSKTYTPTTSQQTETITPDSGYDGLDEVDVTVNAVPSAHLVALQSGSFETQNNVRKWKDTFGTYADVEGWVDLNQVCNDTVVYNAVASGTTVTPSTSSQTIGGANYMMEGAVTVSAMPSGSATPASTITGSSATVSTGTNTLTLSKTVSNTPQVSAGYVSSGTSGNTSISLTANVTTKGATTYRASTTQQTIASGTYLTGVQTIAPVSQTNLSAENIKSGTTISISDGANNIWSVTGTYSGGGGSSNWTLLGTKDCGTISTSSTTAATINKDFSVSGVGDYDLLVVETSVNTKTNGRHAATARLIWLTAGSTIGTKNGATIATATWNVKLSSSGVATSRASTTPRGIYPYSCTVSTTNNVTSAAIVMYSCYNSTQTGTINGTYTARVYGVKLYDLIGG
jgi:hypothetical protein